MLTCFCQGECKDNWSCKSYVKSECDQEPKGSLVSDTVLCRGIQLSLQTGITKQLTLVTNITSEMLFTSQLFVVFI